MLNYLTILSLLAGLALLVAAALYPTHRNTDGSPLAVSRASVRWARGCTHIPIGLALAAAGLAVVL